MTRPVEPLPDHKLECMKDGEPRVPQGFYSVEDLDGPQDGGHILHLADKVHSQLTKDFRRLNGCCGLDGQDGMNTLCENGQEIGTECSDCWMPHYLWLNPESVVVKS